MTLVQQILADHGGGRIPAVGEIVEVSVDRIYAQDGNIPTLQRLFRDHRLSVRDPARAHFVCDHSVLAPDRAMATRVKEAQRFAAEQSIEMVPLGEGISHLIAAERRWFRAGQIVLGADSHTCTGGLYQALALGMGATDIAAALAEGVTWLRVPQTVRVEIVGTPSPLAGPKDVMLHILARFDPTRFLYTSIEWCGDWIEGLSADGAATIANMSVELGAKCCFLSTWRGSPGDMVRIDPAAQDGADRLRIDIAGLEPQFADGHAISTGRPVGESDGRKVDYVFVGSCANGRLEDIATVAGIVAGRRVAPHVRLVVTAGSRRIQLDALRLGYVSTLVESGALVTPAGCGACVGTQGHVPADGDVVVSTMNRNFLGRMGNQNAEIILASPLVASVAALLGRLPTAGDLNAAAIGS